MDRYQSWQVFVAVAGQKSFSGAARTLGRSPQAITRSVAALEQHLGTRLLNRTTRSVSLTGDGERLFERARQTLQDFERLESTSADAPLAGRLSVTSSVLFGQRHVVPVATDFLRAHPDVDVRLVLLDRVVSLAEEGLDVGVRLGALPDSALRARQVGRVSSIICASPAYLKREGVPKSPQALNGHACIAFTGTTPIADRWSFPRPGGRDQSVSVRPRLIVNTAQAALDAASAGLGLVRLLSYQAAPLLASGELKRVLAGFEPEPLPVQLVQLPGVASRLATAFVEFSAEQLRHRLGQTPAATRPAPHSR